MADSDEMPAEAGTGTERILAFSDGVFAIAITLLVLDLKKPDVTHGLLSALEKQWPAYLSYLITFFVIGVVWAQHHHIFSFIARSDHTFRLINIGFLMFIALIPFPTGILADYLVNPHERQTAMALYAGIWVIGTIPFNLLWGYAAYKHQLLRSDVDPEAVHQITRSYLFGPVIYLVDFFLAFISVPASFALFLLIAVFYAVAPLPGAKRVMPPVPMGRGARGR
jgi:uncharacterized membrane protein